MGDIMKQLKFELFEVEKIKFSIDFNSNTKQALVAIMAKSILKIVRKGVNKNDKKLPSK
jgi:hypothetical protein